MSRAEGGGEGALKRRVNAGVKGVIDEDEAAAAVLKTGSGRCVHARFHFFGTCWLDSRKNSSRHLLSS